MRLEIQQWDEEKFDAAETEWQELLARSNADPLFNSWQWLHGWWRHQRDALDAKLHLIAFYAHGSLVGLAPFYVRTASHRGVFGRPRLELMGSSWRQPALVFSEYLDVIIDRDFAAVVAPALGQALLEEQEWADLVVGNTAAEGVLAHTINRHLCGPCYVRETDALSAHVVALPKDFATYVRALSSGVRRKVWNHRAKLTRPELRDRSSDVDAFFDELDVMHEKRWGTKHYEETPRKFHVEFAKRAAQCGELALSELVVDGKGVSLMYNVRVRDKEYNIQSAFDPSSLTGMSPGYLHLGYALERACGDRLAFFDLLCGGGRHRDYKSDFGTAPTRLASFQAIRSQPLAWLYRVYDRRPLGAIGVGLSSAAPIFSDDGISAFLSNLS